MQKKEDSSYEKFLILVGSYTEGFFAKDVKGDGLYSLIFDTNSKKVQIISVFDKRPNLSFLCSDKTEKIIFAVSEVESSLGQNNSGALISLAIDEETFVLKEIDAIPSNGKEPCHVSVDNKNQILAVSNYTSGSFSIIVFDKSNAKFGKIIETRQLKFDKNGPVIERQDKPYAHSAFFNPLNNFFYICDLGGDKIHIFTLDLELNLVSTYEKQPFFSLKPGSGPRHLCISEDGLFLYCLNELRSSISVCTINSKENEGSLNLIQEINLIPEDYQNANTGAEIKLHPNGKFLFASNRGYDIITVYFRNQKTGVLTLLKYQSTLGISIF